ncbi:MAG: NAD-dependent epimerase/dehydratase family protein [Actinomycetota bacterium]
MIDPGARLTVAVTGPTGEIGGPFVRALDRSDAVGRIVGMARRPFDPHASGLRKVEYLQGDILDRTSVQKLVDGADVVVHLAFLIFDDSDQARSTNLEGARNVFEESFAAGTSRLVYASSVAAYGFHKDNPDLITEEVEARGSANHYYSQQKADVEQLLANLARSADTDVFVFRPCIVAGPDATALIDRIPYVRLSQRLPDAVVGLAEKLPLLRPVIPDPGVPIQLVHHDDVAGALVAAVLGQGAPGAYNLAGDGRITLSDLAHALGWYAVPLPAVAVKATATIISKMPYLPAETSWINAVRVPVLVDSTKAKNEFGWKPLHNAFETLASTVAAARARGTLPWPGGIA